MLIDYLADEIHRSVELNGPIWRGSDHRQHCQLVAEASLRAKVRYDVSKEDSNYAP